MFARLKGTVVEKHPPELVLDVGGVGYEILAPMTTFYELPEEGQPVTLQVHLVVREDSQQLFGFISANDKQLFKTLIKINGVGPKLALSILSYMPTQALIACIQCHDVASIVRIPGIGKKTAERLMIEMQDKLPKPQGADQIVIDTHAPAPHNAVHEAISALISLGYKPAHAEKAINSIQNKQAYNTESLIKHALQELASA